MAEFTSLNGFMVKDATARSIAKGRNQAVAYSDYATMIEALNEMEKEEFKTGQNIYIGTVGVPDLWVYAVESIRHTFTYVSDESFAEMLKENTTVQVGFFKLAMLEGQKVDLTTVNEQLAEHEADITELNQNMQFPDNVGFYPDIKDGVRGYNIDAARGADTFFPFSVGEIEYINSIEMVYEMYDNIQHHKIYFDETYSDYTRLLVVAPLGNASASPTLFIPNATVEFDKTVSQSGSKWVGSALVLVDTYINMCIISDFSELEYLDYQYVGTGVVTCYVFGIK